MVGEMKFEGPSLTRFLVSNLEPLTEADPAILAEYVTALLKKDKPASEVQKLCTESLFEFLGNDTNPFIVKMFKALEDGSLAPSSENAETINEIQHPAAVNTISEVIDNRDSLKRNRVSSPSVRSSDSEDKEVSDEDDDDRNHKHRRRESQPVSSDKDLLDTNFKKPDQNRKHFENGDMYQSHDNPSSSGGGKFGKQRPGFIASTRAAPDFNRKLRGSQVLNGSRFGSSRLSSGRGRGRSTNWNHHDGRLGSVDNLDYASQMASLASTPGLFAAASHNPSWVPFSVLHGVPNGALDTLHPLGLQGTLQPQINPSMGIGISRQRCRDFDERGFCLRGDMCPMEHGVNRIVVDDVQCLSQFNLPVSLPTTRVPELLDGNNSITPSNTTLSILANSTTSQSRNNNVGTNDGGASLPNEVFSSAVGADSELYDPDQPLLNGKPAIVRRSSIDYCDSAHNSGVSYHNKNDDQNIKGKMMSGSSSSTIQEMGGNLRAARIQNEDMGPVKIIPTQRPESIQEKKASRTLFVGGIPSESNKRVLFSHFQKFGVVIDIHIPKNSNKAFVQFAKREEAEAALKAPDAVMGSRFIKLRWANRDNIPDEVLESMNASSDTVKPFAPAVPISSKPIVAASSFSSIQTGLSQKSGVESGSKVTVRPQKQLENMELLKTRQESLEKKRKALLLQLEKYEKQAASGKSNVSSESASKRQKVDTGTSAVKIAPPTVIGDQKLEPEKVLDGNSSPSDAIMSSASPKAGPTMMHQYPKTQKLQSRFIRAPFPTNRFKLDNRPTSFGILPPLPSEVANVKLLKDHFSTFEEFVSVELEDSESIDVSPGSKSSHKYAARVSFSNRHLAEQAFGSGRCLQGHNLNFEWLKLSNNLQNLRNTPNNHVRNSIDGDKQLTCIETGASVSSAVNTEKLSDVTGASASSALNTEILSDIVGASASASAAVNTEKLSDVTGASASAAVNTEKLSDVTGVSASSAVNTEKLSDVTGASASSAVNSEISSDVSGASASSAANTEKLDNFAGSSAVNTEKLSDNIPNGSGGDLRELEVEPSDLLNEPDKMSTLCNNRGKEEDVDLVQ